MSGFFLRPNSINTAPRTAKTSQVGAVSTDNATGSHSHTATWRSIAGCSNWRLVEWIAFQVSPSLVI